MALTAAGGLELSRTSVWQAVESLGWDRKKSVPAAERDTEHVLPLRRLFVEALSQQDVTRLVSVDETPKTWGTSVLLFKHAS